MTSISFSICSLIYIIIFAIVYFSRSRIKLTENKIYSALLITTILGLVIDVYGYFSFKDLMTSSLKNITIAKIYLIYYFTWSFILTLYTYVISFKNKNKYKEIFKICKIIYYVLSIIILLLPIHIHIEGSNLYSYGSSVNLVYILSGICVLIMLICIIRNIKNIRKKEYIPMLTFIFFGGIVMMIQKYNPNLLLLITCQSIVTSLMYFTIENPDVKMIEELNKNKKLIEKHYEEKTNFLFKISQELKKPLQDITNLSNEIINEEDINLIKSNIKKINYESKQLYKYVNTTLDVSQIDAKNIKIISGSYNIYNLFEEIKLRVKNEIKNQNKNIDFRTNISNEMPKNLYGDNTKLKQIIVSILFNAIKYTKKGFVELNVSSVVRYNACRLIIEISDTGVGIELDKINEILNINTNLTEEEIKNINQMDIDLNTSHKIIKILNGNLIIKSEVNNGSTFIITLDQKIKEEKKSETLEKIEQYSNNVSLKANILLMSVNENIKDALEENLKDIEIVTSLYGKDCISKLESNQKYKCILIDEKLSGESGIDILKQIKKISKIPVIILIERKNDFLAKHYLSDGFDNYIIKENLKKEIKKINKYI